MKRFALFIAALSVAALISNYGEVAEFKVGNLNGKDSITNSYPFTGMDADGGLPSSSGPIYSTKLEAAGIEKNEWVKIQNRGGVSNKNVEFTRFDMCHVEPGGNVKVVALKGAELLVRYQSPSDGGGTRCPDGTLFIITSGAFLRMANQ